MNSAIIPLSQLPQHKLAIIRQLLCEPNQVPRLAAIGLITNCQITVMRRRPTTLLLQSEQTLLALSRTLTDHILVEPYHAP